MCGCSFQMPSQPCRVATGKTQVASISTFKISESLEGDPVQNVELDSFGAEQQKDTWICDMAAFLQERKLPENDNQARVIAAQSLQLDIIYGWCPLFD